MVWLVLQEAFFWSYKKRVAIGYHHSRLDVCKNPHNLLKSYDMKFTQLGETQLKEL